MQKKREIKGRCNISTLGKITSTFLQDRHKVFTLLLYSEIYIINVTVYHKSTVLSYGQKHFGRFKSRQ